MLSTVCCISSRRYAVSSPQSFHCNLFVPQLPDTPTAYLPHLACSSPSQPPYSTNISLATLEQSNVLTSYTSCSQSAGFYRSSYTLLIGSQRRSSSACWCLNDAFLVGLISTSLLTSLAVVGTIRLEIENAGYDLNWDTATWW